MIEPMKKVTIFSLKERRQSTTEELRRLGLMHIESMTLKSEGAVLEEAKKAELEKILAELEEVKEKKEKVDSLELKVSFDETEKALLALSEEKKALSEEISRLTVEKERLEAFGNLEPSLVESLRKEDIDLHFYTISVKDYRKIKDSDEFTSIVLKGGLSKEERKKRIGFLKADPSASLITTPETLIGMIESDEIRILRGSTELVVIDEAHTAVTWGETFRDAYRKLPEIIRAISPLIVLAFTATADNRIGKGILNGVFSGRNVHIVHSSPDRENIFYKAVYPLSKDKEARRMLQDPESRPAVIFLRSRILAERIASALSDEFPAACYHAGLPAEERREKEEWFSASADGVLAATCAYGIP